MNTTKSKSEKVLKIEQGAMTHEQVGKILALANEISYQRYKDALEWLVSVRTEAAADAYINWLAVELDETD